MLTRLTLCVALTVMPGCFWTPTKLVAYPDSPAVITETKRGYVHLFLWSRERRKLVDYGWVKASDYEGWTLTKFDWEKYAKEQE